MDGHEGPMFQPSRGGRGRSDTRNLNYAVGSVATHKSINYFTVHISNKQYWFCKDVQIENWQNLTS